MKTSPRPQTAAEPIRFYPRLGTAQILDQQLAHARQAGGQAQIDHAAGTVEARFGDSILFRALRKDRATWIILYNPSFYPRQ